MATQTTKLTKSQIVQAIQNYACTVLGVDPNTVGLTGAVRIINELDDPPHAAYPQASVTITTP